MRRWLFLIATLLPALILVACVQSAVPREGSFPTPQELDQLRRAAPSESPFPVEVLDVPSWELEEPLAERIGATPKAPATVWDGFLAEAVARREGLALATEEMHCVAREVGRFHLAHRRQPTSGLLRFIAARCGVPTAAVSFGQVVGSAPGSFSEDRLFQQWRSTLREVTESQLVGGPRFVGIWFGRQEDYAVAIVAAGERADAYRRPPEIASLPVVDPVRLPEEMTALVNRLRREAEFVPLQLAPEQSRVASELAPHFFSALFGQTKEEFLDLVLLGMMAGWQVDGVIQRSQVSSTWVSASNDVGRLLAEALEHPMSRGTLMDPRCEKIAIGALVEESDSSLPALTALIATYAMFSEASDARMHAEIFQRFTRARAERGLGPPNRLPELDAIVVDAAHRVESGEDRKRALSWLIDESVEVLQRAVNGWIFEVTDLDQLEFPEDFLVRRRLGLAIGVSHCQPEGEPWGRYVVMLVAAEPEHRTAAGRPKDGLAPL